VAHTGDPLCRVNRVRYTRGKLTQPEASGDWRRQLKLTRTSPITRTFVAARSAGGKSGDFNDVLTARRLRGVHSLSTPPGTGSTIVEVQWESPSDTFSLAPRIRQMGQTNDRERHRSPRLKGGSHDARCTRSVGFGV
jgi:hypothetical protein